MQPRAVTYSGAATLPDVLERILDKGIVIAGDISILIGSVELITIRIRLLVASVDKAVEMGIDWWKTDPLLSSRAHKLEQENQLLKQRLDRLESRAAAASRPGGGAQATDKGSG
jgi:hypothetical protein